MLANVETAKDERPEDDALFALCKGDDGKNKAARDFGTFGKGVPAAGAAARDGLHLLHSLWPGALASLVGPLCMPKAL